VLKTPPTTEPLPEITPFVGTNGETTRKPAGDGPSPKKKEKKPKKTPIGAFNTRE
jgi:hypothetical protein